jgi:tetratricopeptide (TPR) repeat protein
MELCLMVISRPHLASRARRALGATLLLCGASALLPMRAALAQSPNTSRAVSLFEQGDYPAARTELDAALRQNPNDADALCYTGRIALQQGRSNEAVDWLEKAIRIDDRKAEYHVWLGAALGEEAQRASKFRQPFLAKRVKTEFERAVSLDPRNVAARFGLVQFYAIAPGFMGGGMDKARQQVSELAAISPLQGHVGAAFLALRAKDNAGAEREYEGAIAAAPDSALGYLSLGALYQRLERWNDAFATYDRLLERHPDDMSAHYQIGRTAALSGQNLDRGEQSIKLWLAKPPRNAPRATMAGAHHRLGQIYEKRGRRDAARAEYEEAVRLNPNNEDAKKSLAALG